MPAQFAAETGVAVVQCFFHEGVADPLSARSAAVLENFFLHNMTAAQVIHDRRTGIGLEEIGHHQRGHNITGHSLSLFVHHHQPVGVAVKAAAEVRLSFFYGFLEFVQIRFDQRVGVMFEGPVVFKIQPDQFHAVKVAENDRDHLTGHAVAGVHHHLEGAAFFFQKLQDVLFVFV